MIVSDLRFANRNKQWFIVNVATGTTVSGPYDTAAAAIEARQALAQADTNAQMDSSRRRAAAWQVELEEVSTCGR